ncbi:MAG: hypothetical protein EOM85_04840 [Candidatus Moranbacteria bacterium]|nr:hypothetical protein [Candidatus Moranbacteria bacterium]
MDLPELPEQHKKKEADFGLKFRRWIENNPQKSCSFELKHTRGKDYFMFDELKSEQIAFASKIKRGVLIRVPGTKGEPDYVYLKSPAYVVIKYPKNFYVIDIDNLVKERDTSKRKSLTEDRAKLISERHNI